MPKCQLIRAVLSRNTLYQWEGSGVVYLAGSNCWHDVTESLGYQSDGWTCEFCCKRHPALHCAAICLDFCASLCTCSERVLGFKLFLFFFFFFAFLAALARRDNKGILFCTILIVLLLVAKVPATLPLEQTMRAASEM